MTAPLYVLKFVNHINRQERGPDRNTVIGESGFKVSYDTL